MISVDLGALLDTNYTAWESFHLADSRAVVDSNDLSCTLSSEIDFDSCYNGEYLKNVINVRRFLSNLTKCNIQPLFLASGCPQRQGDQMSEQLRQANENMEIHCMLNSFVQQGEVSTSIPFCWDNMLNCLLEQSNMEHVTCRYSAKPICVGLSRTLNCPLIASDPDYFLLVRNPNIPNPKSHDNDGDDIFNPPYISARHLSLYPVPRTRSPAMGNHGDESCVPCYLPTYTFNHHNSDLAIVSSFHLPLLICMLGSDVVYKIKLPKFLESMITLHSSVYPNTFRWIALLKWISLYGPDSVDPIDQFLDCYTPHEQQDVMQKLCQYVSQINRFPTDEFNQITSLMNLNSPLEDNANEISASDNPGKISRTLFYDICRGADVKLFEPIDFTTGWSTRFLEAYHRGRISKSILTTLYCPGGTIMPQLVEDTNLPNSIHDASFLLRLLQYRILTGVEHQLGLQHKLVGLKPNAVEYVRFENQLVSYEIPVRPLQVDFGMQTVDQLVEEFLGVRSGLVTNAPWLFSLALTLSIWFRSLKFTDPQSKSTSFTESALGLAIGVCATANYHNLISSVSMLNNLEQTIANHYSVVQQQVDPDLSLQSSSTARNLNVIHHFGSVQLIYHCLESLVHILNYLSPPNLISTEFEFPPTWVVFPSGELVHTIAVDLLKHESSKRCSVVRKKWIPKLCFIEERNVQAITKLQRLCTSFDSLINSCVQLEPKLPGNLNGLFTIKHNTESSPTKRSESIWDQNSNKENHNSNPSPTSCADNSYPQQTELKLITNLTQHFDSALSPLGSDRPFSMQDHASSNSAYIGTISTYDIFDSNRFCEPGPGVNSYAPVPPPLPPQPPQFPSYRFSAPEPVPTFQSYKRGTGSRRPRRGGSSYADMLRQRLAAP